MIISHCVFLLFAVPPLVIPESRVQIRTIKYSGEGKEKGRERGRPERRYVNRLSERRWDFGIEDDGEQGAGVPHVCFPSAFNCFSKGLTFNGPYKLLPVILRSRLSVIN